MKRTSLLLTAAAVAAAVTTVTLLAQSVPQPGLKITQVTTNGFTIQITNGVSWANYELYRRTLLDPVYPWTLEEIGSQGQTNFAADYGIQTMGFFEITVGLDWDGDGIDNWQDAQPTSASVGVLSLTIDSPLNGSTIQ